MTSTGKRASVVWTVVFCLMFAQLVELRPQNRNYNRQDVGHIEESSSTNLIRKDFFILEIPEEAIEDEIEEQMSLMMEKRWKQQIALDRFVLRLYEEFQKREREGSLDAYHTRL